MVLFTKRFGAKTWVGSMRDDVSDEYNRWKMQLPEIDPYAGPKSIGIIDVLWAHFCLVDFFAESGEGIGGVGPRNLDLLHSALYRQHISYDGKSKWDNDFDRIATVFFGIIMNHPFHDANKRTAFLSCIYHLQKVNRCLTITESEFEEFTVLIAERKLEKYSRYKDILKRNSKDPEVEFISWFLKKHSRMTDNKFYSITYRQLNTILNGFGFDMKNPRNNCVDIIRTVERRRILGIAGPKEKTDVKVCQIGFPNWTSQVGRGAIKTIRESCKLDHKNGFDSQSFFKNADPIDCLIARYQEPIRSLAYR